MNVSVFDLFKLGVGPSSSHTMGPMTAAGRFLAWLAAAGALDRVARIQITLYASLALTGRGHATDRAVILGLAGLEPRTLDPDTADEALAGIRASGRLPLAGGREIAFDEARDLIWEGRTRLPQHPNALRFRAFDADAGPIGERLYFSVGGGFVRDEDEMARNAPGVEGPAVPYPYATAAELLDQAAQAGLSIAELVLANERVLRPEAEILAGLDEIVLAMYACIERGMRTDGVLPGGLQVKRRAAQVLRSLSSDADKRLADPLAALDWVNLWALAVNEENAAGGRVVTAPTNGAAGLLPAVLRYYDRFLNGSAEGRRTFLLTAAAIGALYKTRASISGAEVGCQGEVGVACSMEHNLGLTCDPIGGLVQIPCIERNAMGAVKAIDATRLALLGDGQHSVSLDKVIATMKRTGEDMSAIYKETSLGGLAVNLAEC